MNVKKQLTDLLTKTTNLIKTNITKQTIISASIGCAVGLSVSGVKLLLANKKKVEEKPKGSIDLDYLVALKDINEQARILRQNKSLAAIDDEEYGIQAHLLEVKMEAIKERYIACYKEIPLYSI